MVDLEKEGTHHTSARMTNCLPTFHPAIELASVWFLTIKRIADKFSAGAVRMNSYITCAVRTSPVTIYARAATLIGTTSIGAISVWPNGCECSRSIRLPAQLHIAGCNRCPTNALSG